jgi:hypothetical protein
MKPRKAQADKRDHTLVFRVSKAEYEEFGTEAANRHMEKAELLRHLTSLYFIERIVPARTEARELNSSKNGKAVPVSVGCQL